MTDQSPASSPLDDVVIIGAGPAGLTAAYELGREGDTATVLEATNVIGGISQTATRDGWRFDIGGHRFFTKVGRVEAFWHEILNDDDFLLRPRMSRIYYDNKFFDYPLKVGNVLKNLGIIEAVRSLLSYLWVRINPPKDQSNFEGWVAARFGWRLYGTFFKTYTEKVWGIEATEIQADWAAQRIKNLSFFTAVLNAMSWKRNQTEITSLIEQFEYPKFGPGMMWEVCTEKVQAQGTEVIFEAPVTAIKRNLNGATAVVTTAADGTETTHKASTVISSMPIPELVLACDPPAPANVQMAAKSLSHRDFLTVALVIPEDKGFPDNWIYVHDPGVKLGRIQNFASWSPEMVKDGRTCLGLEYFVFEGDELWTAEDDALIELGKRELEALDLVPASVVEAGYVVRMPKAYPTYDEGYDKHVDTLRHWLSAEVPNVFPVGRNGMHRYNNQDHSMYTAMLTIENLRGADHDVWAVNVEEDYHEEVRKPGEGSSTHNAGTGRAAPILPRRTPAPEES